MRKGVFILGSCVSRDAFNDGAANDFCVKRMVARTSLISLNSPPLPLELSDLSAYPNNFEGRCIVEDFTKEGRNILNDSADYLVVDFIDERFDLAKIGQSYVLATPFMEASGALDRFPNREPIQRLCSRTTTLWFDACAEIFGHPAFRAKFGTVVLHKAWHASHYRSGEECRPFEGFHANFSRHHNPMLKSYYEAFMRLVPEVAVIEVDKSLIMGDGAHRWRLQPFHYIPEYYAEFMRQLKAI